MVVTFEVNDQLYLYPSDTTGASEDWGSLSLPNMLGMPYLDMIQDLRNLITWNIVVDARAFASIHFEK